MISKKNYSDSTSHYSVDKVGNQTLTGPYSMEDALMYAALLRYATGEVDGLILPYLIYGRDDHGGHDHINHLHEFGKLLNTFDLNWVLTYDVHSPAAHLAIDKLINISPAGLINRATAEMDGWHWLCPDAGAYKKVHHIMPQLDNPPVEVHVYGKYRNQETGQVEKTIVPESVKHIPKDARSLVIDDICDGGRTFIEMVKASPNLEDVSLCVSHGIFSRGFYELADYFVDLYTTTSFKPNNRLGEENFSLTKHYDIDMLIKEAVKAKPHPTVLF